MIRSQHRSRYHIRSGRVHGLEGTLELDGPRALTGGATGSPCAFACRYQRTQTTVSSRGRAGVGICTHRRRRQVGRASLFLLGERPLPRALPPRKVRHIQFKIYNCSVYLTGRKIRHMHCVYLTGRKHCLTRSRVFPLTRILASHMFLVLFLCTPKKRELGSGRAGRICSAESPRAFAWRTWV